MESSPSFSSFSSSVFLVLIVGSALIFGSFTPASAQTSCPLSLSTNGTPKSYSNCTNLQNQGSTLSWSFGPNEGSNSLGGTLEVAFRTTLLQSSGWAGWGINLERANDMVGTNALIAFRAANGSNVLPYKLIQALKSSRPPTLVCSPIDIVVLNKSVEILDNGVVTIFATIRLPANLTVINQFWNRGRSVTDFSPAAHDLSRESLSSFGTLDVSSGDVTEGTVDNDDKNNHGILNAVAWGILIPIGIMSARYIRSFTDSLWFYIHVPIQVVGFIIGAAGFGTGLKLDNNSGQNTDKHQSLGITIVTLAAVQITALFLRPKPDHKLRLYWNVYHHGVGYVIVILAIINIFEGFELLKPEKKYKHAYIGVISALAAVALVLEIVTWAIWLRKRARSPPERLEPAPKASNVHTPGGLKIATYDGQL